MIDETLDTVTDIMEPLNFVNISARRVYSHTPDQELYYLSKMSAKQYNWDLKNPIDRICCNTHIINSVLYN